MTESIAYKFLALLNPDNPEIREAFGIEAPAFVSPYAEADTCAYCGRDYYPLLYQIGRETVSTHAPRCQGIFRLNEATLGARLLEAHGKASFLCWGRTRDDGRSFEPLALSLLPKYLRGCAAHGYQPDGGAVGLRPWHREFGRYLVPPCVVSLDAVRQPAPWAVEFRDGVPLFQRIAEGAAA